MPAFSVFSQTYMYDIPHIIRAEDSNTHHDVSSYSNEKRFHKRRTLLRSSWLLGDSLVSMHCETSLSSNDAEPRLKPSTLLLSFNAPSAG